MPEINFIFIPAVFFIGIVTSYQDIKFGKIKHKWIGMGLIYFILGYLLLYLLSALRIVDYRGINYSYIQELFINGLISIVIAYLFWKLGIWAAGDAKLFIVYALLIPLDYYSKSYLPYFPSFALLLNIFIPLFLFILIAAFLKLLNIAICRLINNIKNILILIKDCCQKISSKIRDGWQEILGTLAGYTLIFLGLQILMSKLHLNSLWVIILIVIFYRVVSKGIKKSRKALLLTGIILAAYFGYQIFYRHDVLKLILIFKNLIRLLLVFGVANGVLNLYIKYTQVRKIDIHDLSPMMLLSDGGLKELRKELEGFRGDIGTIYPDGLSEGQTELIKKIYLEKRYQTIEIYRTFPFAIWMFFGALLTLGLQRSVLDIFK